MKTSPLAQAKRSLPGLAIGDAFGERPSSASPIESPSALRRARSSRAALWRWTDDTAMTLERLKRAADTDLTAAPSAVALELSTGLEVAAHDTVPFALWVAARHLDWVWNAA